MNENAMKKILAIIVTAVALAVPTVVLTAPPASADTPGSSSYPPGCVTKQEFRKVHRGMHKKRVHHIFGHRGVFADGGAGGYARSYMQCNHRHVAILEYTDGPHQRARMW